MADRQNQQLSSGQRTLVSITKAILHQPRLLVLDEPTASLDPDIAARVREVLLDINRRHGTTLLVTSHNMREVEYLCERVVLMSEGRIVADGLQPPSPTSSPSTTSKGPSWPWRPS